MQTKALAAGAAVACVGAFLALLGADIVPQRVFEPHIPSWLLVVLGLGLILVGVSVFFRIGSPTATRLVGVSLLSIAVTFGWVALLGDRRYMSGGIPFVPREYNVFLGRAAFGLVALVFLLLGISALKGAKHQPEEGVGESDL